MKSKTLLASAATLIVSGAIMAPQLVSAYQGEVGVRGPNCTDEKHEIMTQAFESNDYQTWSEQMQGRGRVTEMINSENFARFAEAHQLALSGEAEKAAEIRTELGLGLGVRRGAGDGRGQQKGWNR